MALVKCKKCDKEISDKSINCIHCGYKKQNLKLTFIIIAVLCTILFIFLIAMALMSFFRSISYVGTWTQIIDYYDEKNPNNFICRLENKLVLDEYERVLYTSKITKGSCNHNEIKANGMYEIDGNHVDVEFFYNGEDIDIDLFFKDDHVCFDKCLDKKDYFYKQIEEKDVITDYKQLKDNSLFDYDSFENKEYFDNDFDDYTRIIFEDYKKLNISLDKFIIIIGNRNSIFTEELEDMIDDIDDIYNFPLIYYLDLNDLTEEEQKQVFIDKGGEFSIPSLMIYNNGFKKLLIGSFNKKDLINELQNYNMLDNSL